MNTIMRILDLFAGIGGFSLGLHRASKEFQTVAFCEQDPFCTQILNKHWPDVPVYPDIRKLNGKEIGAIDIVCGGFPCQPFSQAGKQRGKADDRDLWPEMFRVIKECVPTYVIGENVAGFVNMELDRTVSDLAKENYEVRVFILGAVAVQAPHQRQRCWIVAHSDSRLRETKDRQLQTGRDTVAQGSQDVADSEIRKSGITQTRNGGQSSCRGSQKKPRQDVADSECERQSGSGEHERPGNSTQDKDGETDWFNSKRQGNKGARDSQRGMGDLADGLSAELLDIGRIWEVEPDIPRVTTGEKDRTKKLKALGNSVVPQIPEILGRLIIEIETAEVS